MIKKLKGIPVWFIAALLIAGTVAGAGIWILTVEVPVDYDEPVTLSFSDETMYPDDEWVTLPLRDTTTTPAVDLTYGEYNVFLNADNPEDGKEDVELSVEIQAYIDDTETDHIGFVVIEDEITMPQDTDYDEDDIDWGSTEFSQTLGTNEDVDYTVIYVVDDVEIDPEEEEYKVEWTVTDSTE